MELEKAQGWLQLSSLCGVVVGFGFDGEERTVGLRRPQRLILRKGKTVMVNRFPDYCGGMVCQLWHTYTKTNF